MSFNKLSGSLPEEIGNMTSLIDLRLNNNVLSGPIPSTFVNQSRLFNLGLRSNNLSGEIPPSICNLRSLEVLYLSDNNLEGAIPDCLGNLGSSALVLSLNANKLSGIIPSTFPKGCRLESINLNGNKLEGPLPQTLGNCQDLVIVDIADNKIQGAFPFWMETLPQLRVLVLRSNKFNGTMSVFSKTEQPFPKLQALDVSYNAFVGSLPDRYFKNFRGMIDAKGNQTNDGARLKSANLRGFIDLRLTLKGLDQSLIQLLTTFNTIDLSSNRFSGSIPPSIGLLNSLILRYRYFEKIDDVFEKIFECFQHRKKRDRRRRVVRNQARRQQ
ncbi:receptor like protein 22-like [Salvia hispanica]|uniref:receptor like protein 22-like n=1 Tax=Salvia hispanica TaxID=49212 RepID=UPI00200923BB|nr:receptor like protein 22-like [Salvia hispanica]